MWKTLKNRIRIFLWEHSKKNRPMIPKETIDTTLLNSQTDKFLETLKDYLAKDPEAFRKMQLYSYYSKERCPDLNEAITSHLYVCRLCNLYALQYYIMYHFLLDALIKENIHNLKILVFGCGSMIDALSLSFVLRDFNDNFNVHYTGVDIAKWKATFSHPFETDFIQKPLQEYWDDCKEFDGNIIFFPTVISELREYPDDIGQFCAGLEKTKILSDTLFLLVSYRSTASFNKDWKLTDWQKIEKVISTLEKKGFKADHLQFSIPHDWKTYIQSKPVITDEGRSYPCYYLAPPCGSISLSKIAPDFSPSGIVDEYLTNPGNIRLNCPYYPKRRNQYLKKNPSIIEGCENPETVCRQACPIICHPYPKVILAPKTSPCFQIFVFHRS